jgi:integrase/recombinase XerD
MRLPTIPDQEEVARLIDSAANLMHRTMLMMLYATGLRRAEMCHLTVSDIDSKRMVIHVRQGKGGRDRHVLLTPKLLETLREYWRWMKPRTYLFPGIVRNWRADVPITEKIVWTAVAEAVQRAGITKRVSPHTLRHCFATTCWGQNLQHHPHIHYIVPAGGLCSRWFRMDRFPPLRPSRLTSVTVTTKLSGAH